jgi:ABC-2 type transport system permease protein
MTMSREVTAVLAISQRDLLKFLRDRTRMVATFIFPLIFIGALGGSLQATFGGAADFNLLEFTFTGVLAQTLFQTTAFGLISLIEDRENDLTQEIFVSPISRYSIVIGKILGETLVALPQAVVVLAFALIVRIEMTPQQVLALIPSGIAACLLGGAFGLVILANLGSQRAANQIFPFIVLPQYFLAGVFNPIANLPWYLDALSRISPLRYAVDLVRGAYYAGRPDYQKVVLDPPLVNLGITVILFVVFLAVGTVLFVRRERNR